MKKALVTVFSAGFALAVFCFTGVQAADKPAVPKAADAAKAVADKTAAQQPAVPAIVAVPAVKDAPKTAPVAPAAAKPVKIAPAPVTAAAVKAAPPAKNNGGGSFFSRLFSGSGSASAAKPAKTVKVDARKIDRILEKAKESYRYGDLDEASGYVDSISRLDPFNADAAKWRDKVTAMKARQQEIRIQMADDYCTSAGFFLRQGNILDAMLLVNRSLKLDPGSQKAAALDLNVSEASLGVIQSINESDSKKLMKGVNKFLKGDYQGAENTFRSLQKQYPEVNYYLAVASTHLMDRANASRAAEYFEQGRSLSSDGRFLKAQEMLALALEMDPSNLNAHYLFEIVSQELGASKLTFIGK